MEKPVHQLMYDALRACRARFDEYEKSHAAKRTPDGYAKAARNAEMLATCDEAIAAFQATMPRVATADREEDDA